MRPHDITVGVGTDEKFDFQGNYIRLKSASVPITFKTVDNVEVELEQGSSIKISHFDYLLISHNDVAEQDITFYVGDNASLDEAKVAGSVQITGGSDNTNNPPIINNIIDRAFFGGTSFKGFAQSNALSGENSHSQIFNPVGSGITVCLRKIIAEINTAQTVSLVAYSTELVNTNPGDAGKINKDISQPAPLANVHYATNVGVLKDASISEIYSATGYEKISFLTSEDSPIYLREGYGVLIASASNVLTRGQFDWEEF